MANQALFAGLVFDEWDQPVQVAYVGVDPCYVVDDAGFLRHIPSEQVDRQVLQALADSIEGHEDLLTEQAARMLGSEDPFSIAMIASQLKDMGRHFDAIMTTGIPEDLRAYLGMMGFRIRINHHGEVLDVNQPGYIADEGE